MFVKKLTGIIASAVLPSVADMFVDSLKLHEPTPRYIPEKSDEYTITQYQYRFIIYAHRQFLQYTLRSRVRNLPKKTTEDLADLINQVMRTNKPLTVLQAVWNQTIKYEDCPRGQPYFNY